MRDELGALVRQLAAVVGGVWTIKPRIGGVARSHTADEFLPHTAASYETEPPHFFSLSTVSADHGSGGLLGVASVADAVAQISDADYGILRKTVVNWNRPQEFQKGVSSTTDAPVPMSKERARVQGDIINTSQLSESASDAFWAAHHRFFSVLNFVGAGFHSNVCCGVLFIMRCFIYNWPRVTTCCAVLCWATLD